MLYLVELGSLMVKGLKKLLLGFFFLIFGIWGEQVRKKKMFVF